MKAASLLRTVDAMGRVVIPKSLRVQYGIDANCALEIFTDGQGIILRKYSAPCALCGARATDGQTDFSAEAHFSVDGGQNLLYNEKQRAQHTLRQKTEGV